MLRRGFMAAGAASLALPSIGRAQGASTLRFIPQIDLAFLDPHWTTAYVTRNHSYMVFDTLFGQDAKFNYTHQMLAGHVVDPEFKLWKLTLRDGLMWHDGERVLARDCVASIKRWARRDAIGEAMMSATDELSAPDDKTIQFRMKKSFALLPAALGKSPSPMPAMMPERLANTDPFKQITEIIGSGPFRYIQDQRVAGSRNVYRKFDKYVPRPDGAIEWTAGPKIVHFDEVIWTTMPDDGTKSAALQNGEQDWWENPGSDLLALLGKNPKIKLAIQDPTGGVEMMRINHLQPPFNNPAVRRAFMYAIDQSEFMQAIVGDDPSMYYTPLGMFCPKTPMASDDGLEPLKGKRDYAKVKEMLKAAGYNGEKTVLMVPTDYVALKAMGDVMADVMKRVGMNVDYVATDWGTMLQRRNKKDPVEQGGWSAFITGWAGTDHFSPPAHIALRGNGDQASSWPGWCTSPDLERLRNAWFDAPDLAAQQAICREMQLAAMRDVPYYPLGQFQAPTGHRTDITNVNSGFATFWNVRRA
ncbi:MAG: ABC transporter substrate-binding protein [Alphaproteobacteria bacterium]|nr:ABC transporter substrate-binding protein [Alphaproteobacteria bacterium]